MQKLAAHLIRKHGLYDSFYIANMNILEHKINEWKQYLPKVQPFYAIKCNPDKKIINTMIKNDFGFDCASMSELKTVLKRNVSPTNIIYAHPIKRINDLKYAVSNNIQYTTFDSISELEKISQHAPLIKCLIRLRVDNPSARVQLGLKYGATKEEYKDLIDFAKESHIEIVGTSFHVGSASKEPQVFDSGIEFSKEVFQYIKSKGYMHCDILDIGGGFTKDTFKECANVINKSIQTNFSNNLRVIAEPGRYFAEETFTFFTPIVGQRKRNHVNEYWVADGLYGSFNCILYDGQNPSFEVLRNPLLPYLDETHTDTYDSTLFGGTCDSADKIGDVKLPMLRNSDFIMCKNFGAYTIAGSCNFNGIPMSNAKIFYI